MKLQPILNHVLFEFIDEQKDGMLMDKHSAVIIQTIASATTQNEARWGKVIAVGPKVTCVVAEEYVLIESQQWTNAVSVGGKKYWKTDVTKLIAASGEPQYKY